jgi:hypothetical protein
MNKKGAREGKRNEGKNKGGGGGGKEETEAPSWDFQGLAGILPSHFLTILWCQCEAPWVCVSSGSAKGNACFPGRKSWNQASYHLSNVCAISAFISASLTCPSLCSLNFLHLVLSKARPLPWALETPSDSPCLQFSQEQVIRSLPWDRWLASSSSSSQLGSPPVFKILLHPLSYFSSKEALRQLS